MEIIGSFCERLEMVNRVDVIGSGGGWWGSGGVSCEGYLPVTCQIAIDTAVFLVGTG